MWSQLVLVVATAALSSLFTLGLAHLVYRRRYRDELDRKIEKTMNELAVRVGRTVRQGVLDGVSSIPTTEVWKGTQRNVVKTAAELIEGGMNALLGPPSKPEDR